MARLARHFGVSPDRLTRGQLDEFQLELISQGANRSTLRQAVAAMCFFYNKTLARNWQIELLSLPREAKRLPVVLTLYEVSRLLSAAHPVKVRRLLTTMYACGLRVTEATRIKVRDVDSQRMVIHIRQSKWRKDRYVPLGDSLLAQLRDYWKQQRPRPVLVSRHPGGYAVGRPERYDTLSTEPRRSRELKNAARLIF